MKAILYSRVSKDEQDPLVQKRSLIEKANQEGWEYEYLEEKQSTRKTRPVKNEIYIRALKGGVDIICVWKIDRWARSVQELSTDIDTLFNHGVKFISITDSIDLSTPTGRLQFHVISAIAEFERALIRQRTREALDYRKEEIEKKGYFVNKDGKKILSLGRPKGSIDKKVRKKSGYYVRWNNESKKK